MTEPVNFFDKLDLTKPLTVYPSYLSDPCDDGASVEHLVISNNVENITMALAVNQPFGQQIVDSLQALYAEKDGDNLINLMTAFIEVDDNDPEDIKEFLTTLFHYAALPASKATAMLNSWLARPIETIYFDWYDGCDKKNIVDVAKMCSDVIGKEQPDHIHQAQLLFGAIAHSGADLEIYSDDIKPVLEQAREFLTNIQASDLEKLVDEEDNPLAKKLFENFLDSDATARQQAFNSAKANLEQFLADID